MKHALLQLLAVVALFAGFFLSFMPGVVKADDLFVADTTFSVDRGFYTTPISVAITSATVGAEIRYTIDGSKPTETSGQIYAGPIEISETTVLRAIAFKEGLIPTNIDTQTYIFPIDIIAHSNMRTSITNDPTYGPQMEASLQAAPSISLVFDGQVDYTEKEASLELINFERGSFQLDAGMERFGNYAGIKFEKRSVRLHFRKEYGPGKLRFPIFDGHDYKIPPANEFDSIELRSGNHDMRMRGAYMSNRFTDDTMDAMGNISPHGRFVHVYYNGLYNGLYHLRERWNGAMLSEYYRGDEDDYEAINANNFVFCETYDGTGEYWEEVEQLARGPHPFINCSTHVDIANYVDYMLMLVAGCSEREYRNAGAIPQGVPFKFFLKDADGYLKTPRYSVTDSGPLGLMRTFFNEADPDYLTLLADRIHKHYFNDGALTPNQNIARLQRRVDEIEVAFLAEAARWNYRNPASWQAFQDDLINNHFPGLTQSLIAEFRSEGMYPDTVAPSFNQHGGHFTSGFELDMNAPAGTIYYTLDGTDPRESAIPLVASTLTPLVSLAADKSVYIPTSADDGMTDASGKTWTEPDYNDSNWIDGSGDVVFATTGDNINVKSIMHGQSTSCLIRIPFSVAAEDLAGCNSAQLRIRYEDGYIAYLNGIEIARSNFTGTPNGNSQADSDQSATLQSADVSAGLNLLNTDGDNLLAIHGLNASPDRPSFLISAELRVSEAAPHGGTSGAISATALLYTEPISLIETTHVRARVLDGSNWSALNEANFVQDLSQLVVSEIMYNPLPPTSAERATGFDDNEDFEFLELLNTSTESLDLTGLRVVEGVNFDFADSNIITLPADGRIVLVNDRDAFEFRYGQNVPIAGQYGGKLKNEGEEIRCLDANNRTILAFTYDDVAPWPEAADGEGASLILIDPYSLPDHNLPASWTAGSILGGTPGQ